jgi:predicted Zn-dependent protease
MRNKILSLEIAFSLLVIIILFFSSSVIAAGIDPTKRCGTLPPTAEEAEAVRKALSDHRQRALPDIPCTVTIPVAFHIIRHDDGVTGNVLDSQINDQINVLNSSYASTNFQFSLQSVERVNNTAWSKLNTLADEVAMKSALAIDPAQTLNIYTCTECKGFLGWAVFPFAYPEDHFMHGVVALYASFPNGSAFPYNEGDTVTHETGHYLGLYHTFQNGCVAPGDSVDDTPYEASPAYGCPTGRDTCPGGGVDPIENFMDYTDDSCMNHFTTGQSVRTESMIEIYKPSLISCGSGFPPFFFSDEPPGMIYVSVADLGLLFGNEWDLLVKNRTDLTAPFGIGMSFYNVSWSEFGVIVLADDYWFGHGFYGNWTGEGTSAYYSITNGSQGVWNLFTSSPPPRADMAPAISKR